jgi:NAD(P)-dependent dehydrogenase (short-subunit alcohol dehydrogenase family)
MSDPSSFEDRAAIVTGGTLGIGEITVRMLVSRGADVVIVARSEARGFELLQELPDDKVAFVAGDVADPETALGAVSTAIERFGRLDVLVSNAAIDYSGVTLVDTPEQEVRGLFDVNAMGAIFMLQEAARYMRDQGGGAVVNLLSRAGIVGIPGMSVYGATKGALVSLTRTAAVELAPFGIRVNAVAPGATDTPMMRTWIDGQPDPEAFERDIVRGLLGERLARPEEVAEAVLFLASSASSYVTGACLSVDGGYTAM